MHRVTKAVEENGGMLYLACELLPGLNPHSHRLDWSQRFTLKLIIDVSPAQVVHYDNLVS